MPASALHNVTSSTLMSPECVVHRNHTVNCQHLMVYVDLALRALQPCTSLLTLVLDFNKDAEFECIAGQWRHIPANLPDFVSTCKIHEGHDTRPTSAQGSELPVSSKAGRRTGGHLHGHLMRPSLQRFSLSETYLFQRYELTPKRVSWLKERISGGLQLHVPWIWFLEPQSNGPAVLAALPKLAHVLAMLHSCP